MDEHLKIPKEWIESEDLDGTKDLTLEKYYPKVRRLYAYNMVELPKSMLDICKSSSRAQKI